MGKFLLIALAIITISCTENSHARSYGGTQEMTLKPNEELINVTWKDDNLWILTRDKTTGVNYFREKSAFGVVEGQIIFNNHK